MTADDPLTRAADLAQKALGDYDELVSGARLADEAEWARCAGQLAGELRTLLIFIRHRESGERQ